ncbi:hypothetical protein FOCC_FOCC017118 [Frankliniella occidentalis]|nr:hypothetical protein FOCC_FOCC017118 [Frankliniella occidentalis]
MTGNATSYIVVDDNITMDAIIDSWGSNGGWKMNFYRMHVPKVFTFWRTGWPSVWGKIMSAASLPPDHGTTFPPGNYSIKDITSDFDVHYPKKIFYGKFRLTAQMKNSVTGEVLACGRAIFSFVPKTAKTVAVHSKPK